MRMHNKPLQSWRLGALLALAALAGSGCVKSYKTSAPMAFHELPYTSPAGEEWPLHRLKLVRTAEHYGLQRAPEVAYVELNEGGERGTLLFVHGLGSYLKFWRYQLDAFAAQGWHVVAIDLPGYGKSDKPASFPYTMESMADAVRELVGHLGVDRPVLVGHSMGGQTALSYAIRYPDALGALVLTAPAGFETFTAKEKEWFRRAFSVQLITRSSEYNVWGSVRGHNFSRWRPELEWLIEERVRLAMAPGFDRYAYANVRTVDGLTHNDFVRQSLGQVSVPTLIVFGEEDKLIPNPFLHAGFPREVFAVGHAGIRGSQLVGLERCGHSLQLDCPEEYNSTVAEFLAGLKAPAVPVQQVQAQE